MERGIHNPLVPRLHASRRQLRAARTRLLRRLRQNLLLLRRTPHSPLLERFRADRVRAQQLQVWGAGEHVVALAGPWDVNGSSTGMAESLGIHELCINTRATQTREVC